MSSQNYAAGSDAKPQKTLSCSSCRHRKIKCDKAQPVCTQCSRFGLECVYPSRKPNRRAPRPRQRELLDRISRLESIVGQADPEKLQQLDTTTPAAEDVVPDAAATQQQLQSPVSQGGRSRGGSSSTGRSREMAQENARQASASATSSRYLSSDFWTNLSTEVEGIRHALDQPSDDDDDQFEDSPESFDAIPPPTNASGYLMGNPCFHEQHRLLHPAPPIRARLWSIYTKHVDPVMKIIHRPSVAQEFQLFASSDESQHPAAPINALMFCIYFGAVTSLSHAQAQSYLGEPWDVLHARYRILAERALAGADYLNTTSLATLQGFAIFVAMLRRNIMDRSCWSLTALLVRLVQANNLHRDGDGHQFPTFEAEMRRRLWHYCVILDIRGSEDRGSDSLIAGSSYTTQAPTSIDDDAFGPHSVGPLIPKNGPAENVITLTMGMSSAIFEHLGDPSTFDPPIDQPSLYTEQGVFAAVRRLETTFIHTADPNHLQSQYAAVVARIVILRLWLVIQYPIASQAVQTRPRVNGPTMLRSAITTMELCETLMLPPYDEHWRWLAESYVQWHPLAVALSELCYQTEGPLVDGAWQVIDRTLATWKEKIADTAKGSLWKPIRKLLKRAKAARANSMMASMTLGESGSHLHPPQQQQQPQTWVHAQVQPLHAHLMQQNVNPHTAQHMMAPTVHTQQQQHQQQVHHGGKVVMDTPIYDLSIMDPSYLFEYPPELRCLEFDTTYKGLTGMEYSPWNDFVHETMAEDGSLDSGGDSV